LDKRGVTTSGRVVGKYVATGIRPKFAERLTSSGITVPADIFEHSLEI
jgi:pilus assembly protein CpaF